MKKDIWIILFYHDLQTGKYMISLSDVDILDDVTPDEFMRKRYGEKWTDRNERLALINTNKHRPIVKCNVLEND